MKWGIKCIASDVKPLQFDCPTKTERGYEAWCRLPQFDDLNVAYRQLTTWHYLNCYYVVEEYPS